MTLNQLIVLISAGIDKVTYIGKNVREVKVTIEQLGVVNSLPLEH